MRPRPTGTRRQTRSVTAPRPWLGLVTVVLMASGCEEEVRQVGKRPETRAPGLTGIALDTDGQPNDNADARVNARPKAAAPSGPIIGQRTTDIRNAATELQKGGAQVASTRIVAKDPITLQGNAYVSIIGQTSMLNIQHALDLYQAENGRYPKDYNEFMEVIIKANNIALPRLPTYQEYGYDEQAHKLIILEYPDRKAQPLPR